MKPETTTAYRFPASFGQERLWVLEHLTPGVPLYMHAAATRVGGWLDVSALVRALNSVIARHETLRTHFEIVDGELVQVIVPSLVLDVPVIDLSAVPSPDRETEALATVAGLSDETVDLSSGPLLKAHLVRLAEDDHIVVLVAHHAISDAWSMDILSDELAAFYGAYSSGSRPDLAELPIQYADFASWQRAALSGDKLQHEVAHWHRRLDSSPTLLELPTDRPRPSTQTFDGAAVAFDVPASVTSALRALASRSGSTLFMVLLAAFDTLLFKYTGMDDILVATPVAGRDRSEIEKLIGFFVNTLIVRADLAGDPTFEELIARVREAALDAFAHQALPFEKLVEELNPPRDLSHLPFAQVMLVLQSAGAGELSLRGLDGRALDVPVDMAPYDLTFELRESDGRLRGSLIYNTDLFEATTAAQIARHFQTLLERVTMEPAAALSRVSVLGDDERDAILHGWYDSRPDYLPGPLVHESFARIAATTPERVAATMEGPDISYGELNVRANKLAHHLRSLGVGPERVVGLMFEKSVEMLVGLLGVWKAGGAFVPLDPDAPTERASLMLEETGARVVLTLAKLRSRADAAAEPTGAEVMELDSSAATLDGYAAGDPPPVTGPRSLAYIIFTSGSTGAPKGVMVEHGGLVNMARFAVDVYGVREGSRFLQFMSITFDASMSEILPVLTTGATLCLAPREKLLPGPDLAALLREQKITNLLLTPSSLALLPAGDLPDLTDLIVCGEACPSELVARWGHRRRFVNAYGPTEITSFCHAAEVGPDDGTPPIGRPLPNTRSYILDAHLEPVPLKVRGELYVGTIGLARGYLHRPDLTAERFLPDPFGEPGERIYRTGDVVRSGHDGRVEFFGRSDTQVKIRGFRVEPGEIEAVLLEHPSVIEAAVVAVEDSPGETRLACYCAVEDGAGPSELRAFLAGKLPGYMVPAAWVPMDALPHTPSGKVDRKALPEPPSGRPEVSTAFAAPSTPTEVSVATEWHRVLRLSSVGVEDKFFEVGGNSLRLVELYECLNVTYPGALSVAELFEHTTIRAMASVIDRRAGTHEGPRAVAGFEL